MQIGTRLDGAVVSEPAMDQPQSSAPFKAGVLLISLSLGVAAGLALLLPIFKKVPNDLSRIETVLTALRSAPPPTIVIFGDSRAESSIDAGQLSRELPGEPLAYNLGWHAQRFDHSFILLEELPATVKVVIEMISLEDLAQETPGDPRVYRAMRSYGARPTESMISIMERAFGSRGGVPLRMRAP
jgi:hypothetical protein